MCISVCEVRVYWLTHLKSSNRSWKYLTLLIGELDTDRPKDPIPKWPNAFAAINLEDFLLRVKCNARVEPT